MPPFLIAGTGTAILPGKSCDDQQQRGFQVTDATLRTDAAWALPQSGPEGTTIAIGGRWKMAHIGALFERLAQLDRVAQKPVTFDLSALEALDTAGAWLLHRTAKRLRDSGVQVQFSGISDKQKILIDEAAANDVPCAIEPEERSAVADLVADVGATTVGICTGMGRALGFLGALAERFGAILIHPRRLRMTPLVHHMEHVGLRAMPIVGLISFLIGVVVAYLGAQQLKQFGAEVFVVDLLAIAILRELGVLITAIVMAGRSGSAFTAEIGSMMLHEEVDAMRTLGLDPMELLVIPRVLALTLTLPMLTFFADMVGLLGGGLMAWLALDISPGMFLHLLNQTMTDWTFWVGFIKAPVFAMVIAVAGCYEGLRVEGSAESVGRHTTKSVVESIFLIIVLNALFSVFFATLEI